MSRRRLIDLCIFVVAVVLGAVLPARATPECADILFKMTVGSVTIGGAAVTPPPPPNMPQLSPFQARYIGGGEYEVSVYDPDTMAYRTIGVGLK